MSIRDLADSAGVTPKTLTDIEYGRRRPTFDSMRAISKALGISPHDIAEFEKAIESRGQCNPNVPMRRAPAFSEDRDKDTNTNTNTDSPKT